MQRIHYDWEFKDNGTTIVPISVGMISDDDRELYIINTAEVNEHRKRVQQRRLDPVDEWLDENVYSKISFTDMDDYGVDFDRVPSQVMLEIVDFVTNSGSDQEIELWGYYAAYDHVCLAQVFGRMLDLPAPMPMYTNELMTIRFGKHFPARPKEWPEHHALMDARYQRLLHRVWTGLV